MMEVIIDVVMNMNDFELIGWGIAIVTLLIISFYSD